MLSEEERKAKNRDKARRWRAANPERTRELSRQSYRRQRAANPERIQENQRRWREANRERVRELGRESMRRRRAANPERARELGREEARRWRAANPERTRELSRQSYRRQRANPQRVQNQRNACRRWRLANLERHNEGIRKWGEVNHERLRELHRSKNHNRRARLRGATDPCRPVTPANIARREAMFGCACCFCGAGGKLTLEHVVALNRGGLHVPDNLAPSCRRCNSSKNDTPVETWYPRQPFFDPKRWEFLQAHTGNRWAVAEQLTLLSLH